ncbi:MAG: DUF5916 domain-containing protein [Bacteroidales bacterium]
MRWMIIIFLFWTVSGLAQNTKTYSAQRTENPPKIDGVIEPLWQQSATGDGFWMYEPSNHKKASYDTHFYILYDDQALYIACMMYDPQPDSILSELGQRDEVEDLNADHISIDFLPFADGMNGYAFKVTPDNLQSDEKYSSTGTDKNWDAVWHSATSIQDSGWVAEFSIPWSAIRFPQKEKQQWGFTIWRNIRRYREWSTWTQMDKTTSNVFDEYAILENINNIKPPLRLSFTPYFSAYADRIERDMSYSYQGGLDLKYGINESFTLDMTLIPDFGQVISDDIILNLTPYEVQYSEKRPFFTEGTELFNKGGIFYSRRIGDTPQNYHDVQSKLDSGETIVENPDKTQLINATKLSGRTSKGLGIGVFNAMTSNTYAKVQGLNNETRLINTQAFTNYNMIVLDQNLKNNSYVTFVNTNATIFKDQQSANVSGTVFKLLESNKKYGLGGKFLLSHKYTPLSKTELGFNYQVYLSKEKGNFLFTAERKTISKKYNPNDMGYLAKNNYSNNQLNMTYRILNPVWKILNWNTSLNISHEELYKPRSYSYLNLSLNTNGTFRNHLSVGGNFSIYPTEVTDYYEARVAYTPFNKPSYWSSGFWLSSDYRKVLAFDGNIDYDRQKEWNANRYKLSLSPRIRISDQLFVTLGSSLDKSYNYRGFVTYQEPDIIFGRRYTQTLTNTFTGRYAFNVKHSINMKVRHYWATVDYKQYYFLLENGALTPAQITDDYDINFNAFNVDVSYRWTFAPGSEISIVWKNELLEQTNNTYKHYKTSIQQVFEEPQFSSLSVRFLYYIDYQKIARAIVNS